jgi:hypothetical protein
MQNPREAYHALLCLPLTAFAAPLWGRLKLSPAILDINECALYSLEDLEVSMVGVVLVMVCLG